MMKEFDQLQAIWESQTKPKMDMESIIAKATKFKRKTGLFLGICVLGMLIALCVMITIWVFVPFKSIYTHIGISILVATVIAGMLFIMQSFLLINKINPSATPQVFLNEFIMYHTQKRKMAKLWSKVYLLFLVIGFMFYLPEVIYEMSFINKLIVYGIFFAWILIAYFILGKRQQRKEDKKLAIIIAELAKKVSGFQ